MPVFSARDAVICDFVSAFAISGGEGNRKTRPGRKHNRRKLRKKPGLTETIERWPAPKYHREGGSLMRHENAFGNLAVLLNALGGLALFERQAFHDPELLFIRYRNIDVMSVGGLGDLTANRFRPGRLVWRDGHGRAARKGEEETERAQENRSLQ